MRRWAAALLVALLVALPRLTATAQEYTWTPPMLAVHDSVYVSYTLKVVEAPTGAPQPPAPPTEEGRPVREEEVPTRGYVFIPPWLYEPLMQWWWLLLLLLHLLLLLLLLYRRRRRGGITLEIHA